MSARRGRGRGAIAASSALLAACAAAVAPSPPAPPALPGPEHEAAWFDAFDGRTLGAFVATEFGGEGPVEVRDGCMRFGFGSPLTGVTWTGTPPSGSYELEVVAARVRGSDFFCGVTFPVGDAHLTLVLGGWGGSVCGLSSLDGEDASDNATRTLRSFAAGREHRVHVVVTATRVAATLDGAPLVAIDPRQHVLGLRPEVLPSRPLGIAAFATEAAVRVVRWRPLAVTAAPNAR